MGVRRKAITLASLVLFASTIAGFFWFDINYNHTAGYTFDALLSLGVIFFWRQFARQSQAEDGVLPKEIHVNKNWRLIYSALLVVIVIIMTLMTVTGGEAKDVWREVVWVCYCFAFLVCEYLLCTTQNPRKRIVNKAIAFSGSTG
jgi:peptidoglycan/LPS O-acetylase OafA/YrhL